MEYFLGGLVIVLGVWFVLWLATKAIDGNRIATAALVIVLAAIIGNEARRSKEIDIAGPCLKYEESFMIINGVMTPYRYCVQRGEFIK